MPVNDEMGSKMIIVNDEEWPDGAGMKINDILKKLDPRMPIAVVRINDEYISRREWELVVKEGDEVRVVYIIAGG